MHAIGGDWSSEGRYLRSRDTSLIVCPPIEIPDLASRSSRDQNPLELLHSLASVKVIGWSIDHPISPYEKRCDGNSAVRFPIQDIDLGVMWCHMFAQSLSFVKCDGGLIDPISVSAVANCEVGRSLFQQLIQEDR